MSEFTMQYGSALKAFSVLSLCLALVACGNEGSSAKTSDASGQVSQQSAPAEGVVAKVGDQTIHYDSLTVMLNRLAMTGQPIPAPGSRERSRIMISLLENSILAELVYLDAKDKGTDTQEKYLADIKKYEDAVLVLMYSEKLMADNIPVTEREVLDYYNANVNQQIELTDNVKHAIELIIRKQQFEKYRKSIRESLRADTRVEIIKEKLAASADNSRASGDVVAHIGDRPVTWNDVEFTMHSAATADPQLQYLESDEERVSRLQNYIDSRIMLDKALAASLDKAADFAARTAEYRKTHLISVHRAELIENLQPTEEELKAYYLEHRDEIATPEKRKIQMVVVGSREEAQNIKQQIDDNKITMYKAATDYSLDPEAKRTLGEMDWITPGAGVAGLDDFIFGLEPGVVSGPVESPAGWHLINVLEIAEGQRQNLDDSDTHKAVTALYMNSRLNDYLSDLRENHYVVEVYSDELNRHFRQEMEYVIKQREKNGQSEAIDEKNAGNIENQKVPAAAQ